MIWIGTSGWMYADWRARFYPAGLPQRDWLPHFAARFPTVELNNSFYRLPSAETFRTWRGRAPDGFLFAVKASRFITHAKRLRDTAAPLTLLWERARELGPALGPVLFQLPPHFPADPVLLEEFLPMLPHEMRAAFEFRDRSWETAAVYRLLDRAGAALVLADRPRARPPRVVTGGWSYVRFHQGAEVEPGYARAKLRRWADRISTSGARDTFVYFNNDTDVAAVRDAITLTSLLRARGIPVRGPAG